jgi:hypothetical protein
MDHRAKRDLTNELDRWSGVIDHRFEVGSKHRRLVVTTERGSRFITISGSPSDGRAARNKLGDLRKMLRELGATKQ